jgi:hypothetical protein
MQPMPLRGAKIAGILQPDLVPTAVPTYRGGTADGQSVGPSFIVLPRRLQA